MQNLQQVVAKKLIIYRKRGLSQADALGKIINKLIKKRYQGSSGGGELIGADSAQCSSDELDLCLKLKKHSGLTMEETMKTLQLKKEIEFLLE